jgi:polar amino acid transport system substrate-binding protein
LRAHFLPFLLVALAMPAWGVVAPAHAEDPTIPVFWDTSERLAKPDLSNLTRLRFLTTTDFPPFNFLEDGGQLAGFHVDLARAICRELGIVERCQIQALPWSELDGALAAGQGEAIIAGLAITSETRAKYAFSRPFLQFPARFVMPKSSALAEPIYDKLKDKRVGVVAGSAHEQMLRSYFPQVRATAYPTPAAARSDLGAGKIDAVFGDGMQLSFWLVSPEAAGCCRFAGGPYLAPEFLGHGLAIAAPRGNATLISAFNYALQKITGDGTFAELYLRYFPVSFF